MTVGRSQARGVTGHAPGKVILTGEHAVVYGYAAVAIPLHNLKARASVAPASPGYGTMIVAADLRQHTRLQHPSPPMQPLAQAVARALKATGQDAEPDWILQIRSQIPVARGLGSGAAVCCALVRAVSQATGCSLELEVQDQIVHASEMLLHGSPSGIDNLTVVHGLPLYFRKGHAPQFFQPRQRPVFLLADTGISAPTAAAVAKVARLKREKPHAVEDWMQEIGEISNAVFQAMTRSGPAELGPLLNANQELLRSLGVSSIAHEKLIQAALAAGAPAAKVTGAGLGGQVLVLVPEAADTHISKALRAAGATAVWSVQWQMPALAV